MGEGAIDRSIDPDLCRVVSESAVFFPIFCRFVSDTPDLQIKKRWNQSLLSSFCPYSCSFFFKYFLEMSAKVHVGADVDDVAAVKLQSPDLPKPDDTVEFAKCDCCGLTEECTPAYIARIRGRFDGRWICGLCSEAVEEEIFRSDGPITTAEALDRHVSFSRSFRPSSTKPPPNPKEHLISAMRQLLRRSLDSPRAMRSTPSSPRRGREDEAGNGGSGGGVRQPLGRTGSCFSSIGG